MLIGYAITKLTAVRSNELVYKEKRAEVITLIDAIVHIVNIAFDRTVYVDESIFKEKCISFQ